MDLEKLAAQIADEIFDKAVRPYLEQLGRQVAEMKAEVAGLRAAQDLAAIVAAQEGR